MLLIGTQFVGNLPVAIGNPINLGSVYRRYCKKINGLKTFENTDTSITLQQSGIYHITATITASGQSAGLLTFTAYNNGVAIPYAITTETITIPTAEVRTFTLDFYVLVDSTCVLGNRTTLPATITIVPSGVAANELSAVVNAEKVV